MKNKKTTYKLWGGRFKEANDPKFEYFSSSLATDYRLAPYDIQASKIHCQMLVRQGILSKVSAKRILRALSQVERKLPKLSSEILLRSYEDIHSLIEAELIKSIGSDAKRLHAARSRNDQVNVATRMYCKDNTLKMIKLVAQLQKAIVAKAKQYSDIPIAGMTHLQKAQPILISHLWLSYVEMLERAKTRLEDAYERFDVLTLGSGALAGTTLPIDRNWVQSKLGFKKIASNSLDAVGSRDFIAELTFVMSLLGVELSRVAEDFMILQIEEVGIVDLPQSLCTGSSMMPQKKNADFLELARGAASIFVGNTSSVLTLIKSTPSSYNRDLQWDKVPLFDSVELLQDILEIFHTLFKKVKINKKNAERSLKQSQILATDLAEYLVQSKIPFREAHERVGKLILLAETKGCELNDLPLKEANKVLGLKINDKFLSKLTPKTSLAQKRSFGSTGPRHVNSQIKKWERKL